jgi:hypothetical protein
MSQAVENGDATTISLLTSNLRDLSVAFVAESQNLRTQVCRSAVAAIGQLYRVVGKAICTGGPDLDSTVSALLRKYGEGSSGRENFMTEEIDQALDTVCRIQGGWSPTRVMNALISTGADHKNALVRAKVSACLSMIICNPDNSEVIASRLLSNPKDFEKPMLALTKFLGEGLQETRASAKVALLEMDAKTGDLIAVVERILPSKEVNTIREMIQSNVSAGRRSTVAIKLDDQQAGGLARRKTMTKVYNNVCNT